MNPRMDRETTFWYHARCAAFTRPSAILEFLDEGGDLPDADELRRIALIGEARRLRRDYGIRPGPNRSF
ncbi:MAG: hypothetical protein ACI80V_000633 [Rhodothermales bacterium]|jgi:hypothetical protein